MNEQEQSEAIENYLNIVEGLLDATEPYEGHQPITPDFLERAYAVAGASISYDEDNCSPDTKLTIESIRMLAGFMKMNDITAVTFDGLNEVLSAFQLWLEAGMYDEDFLAEQEEKLLEGNENVSVLLKDFSELDQAQTPNLQLGHACLWVHYSAMALVDMMRTAQEFEPEKRMGLMRDLSAKVQKRQLRLS
tara:strand:+ start:36 stop:608 length:573 start_codon:yes stop_codon:yes gene_type:complete